MRAVHNSEHRVELTLAAIAVLPEPQQQRSLRYPA